MVKIKEAIVVEGRYDKNTLSQIVDAPILETNGFGIFKDKAQMKLLRQVAEKRGLIVFTDADGAFTMAISKDGKPTLKLVDLQYCSEVHLEAVAPVSLKK